jgi:hypothetical protein
MYPRSYALLHTALVALLIGPAAIAADLESSLHGSIPPLPTQSLPTLKTMPFDEVATSWMGAKATTRPGQPSERLILGTPQELEASRANVIDGFKIYCDAVNGHYIAKDSFHYCFKKPITKKSPTLAGLQIESTASLLIALAYRAGVLNGERAFSETVSPPRPDSNASSPNAPSPSFADVQEAIHDIERHDLTIRLSRLEFFGPCLLKTQWGSVKLGELQLSSLNGAKCEPSLDPVMPPVCTIVLEETHGDQALVRYSDQVAGRRLANALRYLSQSCGAKALAF